MAERLSGQEKPLAEKAVDALRVMGWALAVSLIGAGVVLQRSDLVVGGVAVVAADFMFETGARMMMDFGRTIKRDMFGAPQRS